MVIELNDMDLEQVTGGKTYDYDYPKPGCYDDSNYFSANGIVKDSCNSCPWADPSIVGASNLCTARFVRTNQ